MLYLARGPMRAAKLLLVRLEQHRERLGISQKEFTKRIGVPESNYSNYKNEKEPWDPHLSTIERIAEKLKLPIWRLISDDRPALLPDEELMIEAARKIFDVVDDMGSARGRR